ncbi:hypothetical protein [Psychrosphaera algicola]|uniref:hypothetical protein n=1 Tax=Psychrosphaera algicola TaxID=3023714 RepID=UPI00351D9CA5
MLSSKVTCFEETEVRIDDNRVSDVNNNLQQWQFDWVIDCRGLGAKHTLLKPDNPCVVFAVKSFELERLK